MRVDDHYCRAVLMRKTVLLCFFCLIAAISAASPARACAVFGDSIGLGLGHALNGACATTAEIGILSSVVASRVKGGNSWTIVSLGSNDYPTGLSPMMRSLSKARVEKALAEIQAKVGSHLVLVLPANEAQTVVKEWADQRHILTVGFEPGSDGVHPRKAGYDSMARQVRVILQSDR